MNCLPILEALREAGVIPPITCLFVSHLNAKARHAAYTCNDRYSRFIAEDVIAWAKERPATIGQGGI